MMRKTFNKELKKAIINSKNPEQLIEDINNILNIMISDICEALKSKAQNSSSIDFIDIVTAIGIVKDGGIPTEHEVLELIDSYMDDNDNVNAKKLLKELIESHKGDKH